MNKELRFVSDSLGKNAKPCSSLASDLDTDKYQSITEIRTNGLKFLKNKVQIIILLNNCSLHCWIHIKAHSQSQNLGGLLQCWPYYNMPFFL